MLKFGMIYYYYYYWFSY